MEPRSRTVAILTPSGSDGPLASRMLARAGLEAVVCRDIAATLECIEDGVGAVVIAEEALGPAARARLTASLDRQPAWSDLPMVVLLSEDELSNAIAPGVAQLAARANL